MTGTNNPLLCERDLSFQLYEVHGADRLTRLPAFAEHGRDTFDLFLDASRRLSRDVLYPAYRAMDAAPPVLAGGRVRVHPLAHALYPRIVELGILNAGRPPEVGGVRLPQVISAAAMGYLLAGNLSAAGFVFLTTGAAHLVEAFGSAELRETYMRRMYAGEWAGTMALTEPQAGSSLADVTTAAARAPEGHYLLRGSKIFISGGDQDLTENIVHLTLARIEGAPPGIKGVSLFVVPRLRPEGGALVDNDVATTGLVHKIGWRGLPSVLLGLGERGDCRGHLVGEPHKGIAYMFQMMNEARILVGLGGAATALVAYHEALSYARTRPQGRPLGSRDPSLPQSPVVSHPDVRRMLLRQKAIAEGSLSLVLAASLQADLAAHAEAPEERRRAALLLDLLTPVAKSFPAERGFESNALAVQVHGGYGYSSEYLPEAWLRDQKLNSLHEGTTGIQGLDLLGRRVVAGGGEALRIFAEEVGSACSRARAAGVPEALPAALEQALALVATLTAELGAMGLAGDVERMLRHSADYLELFSILAVSWQWLLQAAAAREALAAAREPRSLYEGKLCAARYWLATELPRVDHLAHLCRSAESSYADMSPDWF